MDHVNEEINKEQETELAQKIYENRPGGSINNVIPKIGVKFSKYENTLNEQEKLKSYQNAHKAIIVSWKVRKLFNLGLADWLPELGVAKVIKQGKFMQTKGHLHGKGFVALYPEEALFLLDVGDIELTFKGAIISLQDAYNLLLCKSPDEKLCTLDEYHVYSHLCKVGYRVQRCSHVNINSTNSNSVEQSTTACKQVKKLKLDHQEFVTKSNNITNIKLDNNIINSSYRDWWLEDYWPISTKTEYLRKNFVLKQVSFPNFSCKDEPVFLKEIDQSLLPNNTLGREVELLNLWNKTIYFSEKDFIEDKLTRDNFSHPKTIDFNSICRKAKNWSHYSELVLEEEKELSLKMEKLFKIMNSGKVKPLLTPQKSYDIQSVLNNLKYCGLDSNSNLENSLITKTTNFKMKFNVFQSDTTKSFRKTQPGIPLLRVVVCSALTPYPTPFDMTLINKQSDGVPVKFAMVNFGRVLFFGFDDIEIPVLTN